jgi:hypothetical protein
MRSRCCSRLRRCLGCARRTCGGPPPTSAGSSGTPTSCTRLSSSAPQRCSTRASRSGPPTQARSGGWCPSTEFAGCSRSDGRSGHQARRPRRRAHRRTT